MSNTNNALFSATGAALRAAAQAGDAAAAAELARRAAKREASGKWTVAAARSQGRVDIVATMTAAKPAPAPKAQPVAFAKQRDTIKAVRTDLGARLDRVEQVLTTIADSQAKMAAILAKLA